MWRNFVFNSPQGSIFSDDRFLASLGLKVELLGVEENGETLFGFPLLLNHDAYVTEPWPFLAYSGPLFSRSICGLAPHRRASKMHRAVDLFLRYSEEKLPGLHLAFHPSFPDVRPFSWLNYSEPALGQFKFRPLYTGLIDLGGLTEEEFIASVRSVRRQEHRRAALREFRVEKSEDVGELDRLHDLTFARQELARDERTAAILTMLTEGALYHGYGDVWVCRNPQGEATNACLFVRHRDTVYYLVGANDPLYRNEGTSTHLLIECFCHYLREGLRWIDTVGMNSPARGDYKASFNAVPTLYLTASWQRLAS